MLQTFDPLAPLAAMVRHINVQVYDTCNQDMREVVKWWNTAIDDFGDLTPAQMIVSFRFDELKEYVDQNFI